MKVLIVDDAVTFRKLLNMALQSIGFTDLSEAGSAEEARGILQGSITIDLIISDWHMPGETGLDLLRWVRASPALKATPFLMLTTEQERTHILEAARVGLQGYIFKPVQKQILLQKLTELNLLPQGNPSVAEPTPPVVEQAPAAQD